MEKKSPSWMERLFFYIILPYIQRAVANAVKKGTLKLKFANGIVDTMAFGNGNGEGVTLTIFHPFSMFLRLIFDARVGLGESYMYGDYDATPDLQHFFQLLIDNKPHRTSPKTRNNGLLASLFYFVSQRVGWLVNYILHLQRPNSVNGSKKNIRDHYDLGNDMFQLFLDDSMTYSCAYFASEDQGLLKGQEYKLDRILDLAKVGRGDRVLEVGCGWGSCAARAVQTRDIQSWTGLTISVEQLKLAQERLKAMGLDEKVELKLQDYREETATYDKLISIEMLEAVGHQFLPTYFETVARCLKVGGMAAIQSITIPDSQYDKYRSKSDFIKKHIFPGGHLPSLEAIKTALPKELVLGQVLSQGRHYSKTLDIWAENWTDVKDKVLAMGYSDTFYRKWQYYFRLCSSLFANDYIDCIQIQLERV